MSAAKIVDSVQYTANLTQFTGKNIIALNNVASTNTYMAQLLANNLIEGTAVIAENQENGKGQANNQWESEAGKNLLLSVLFYPHFLPAIEGHKLNIAIAVAVANTIALHLPLHNVKIKWPNDIYIQSKKIAGILIENTIVGTHLSTTIVGVGINVNQISFATQKACSMSFFHGQIMDKTLIFNTLMFQLEQQYLKLQQNSIKNIINEYNDKLYLKNQLRDYKLPNGEIVTGTITGINHLGQLSLRIEDKIKYYNHKEIIYL